MKDGEIIKLNVGGTLFAVSKETLDQQIKNCEETKNYEPHYFNALVSGLHNLTRDKVDDSIFIDRDPTFFRYILNYLRSGGDVKNFALPLDVHALESLFVEARYYSMEGLVELISKSDQEVASKYSNSVSPNQSTVYSSGGTTSVFGTSGGFGTKKSSGFHFGNQSEFHFGGANK